ncbi:MAG TPA: PAS domain S-box protein [Acidimicrobiia bacterium]|jgi:PAS domain S-box-containing protein
MTERPDAAASTAPSQRSEPGHEPELRPLADSLDDRLIWSLVDAAPDGIVMADEDGRILLVNRQTEELFGYDRGELLGRPIEELLPEQLRTVHRAHRTRYRADPRPRSMGVGLQLFGRRADNTEFPVEISLSPIATDDGLRIVAAVRDVTDRVAAEARSREIREVLDATADAMSIFDAQTLQFTYVNQGFVEQIGYRADELSAMTMLHIAPEFTEATLRELLAPFERGELTSTTFRTVHRRRDGVDIPVEILMQAVFGDDDRPRSYVKIARDISARLEADAREQQIEQELRVLEDRERVARDLHDLVIQRLFAAGITLQGAIALSDLAERTRRVEIVVDELDQTIREIRAVIFRLHRPVEGDDAGVRHRVLTLVDEQREILGFAPHLQFDGYVEQLPEATTDELLAILREALTNVAKHAHATSATVSLDVRNDELTLRVVDNGVGVVADAAGSGNGLGNMRERADAVGGTLAVRPSEDRGTIVEARLPVAPVATR